MQRFGRGARNLALFATCILLAEPSYFADYKEKRAEVKQKKQAKQVAHQRAQLPPTPRAAEGAIQTPAGAVPALASQVAKHFPVPNPTNTGKFLQPQSREQQEVEVAMDAFINADRLSACCRRAVCNDHFENNQIGEPFGWGWYKRAYTS
jgi:hypothetical protein